MFRTSTLSLVVPLLLTLAPPAISQGNPVADLGVELIQPPSGAVTPGGSGTFIYRLTNYGPESAGSTTPVDRPIRVTSSSIIILPFGSEVDFPNSTCFMLFGFIDPLPGDPLRVDYVNFFHVLDPGESVECETSYTVNSHLDHQLLVTWTAKSLLDEDPDLSNNSLVLVFGPTPPIPTLSPVGATILFLGIFLAFVVVWRRSAGLGFR